MKFRGFLLIAVFLTSLSCTLYLSMSIKEANDRNYELYLENVRLTEKVEKQKAEIKDKNNILASSKIQGYHFTPEDVYLLAQIVEAEVGNPKLHKISQKYVCQVVLNRLNSPEFPNTIREVVFEKSGDIPQFSVAYNGMIEDRVVLPETLVNVYSTIFHGTDLPEKVKYCYSTSVKENWINSLSVYKTVEGTVFAYDDKGDL